MEYYIFIVFVSIFALINIITDIKIEGKVIYYFIVGFVAIAIGLRGIEDEYTRFFMKMPDLVGLLGGDMVVALEKGYLFSVIAGVLKLLGGSSQALLMFFALTSVSIHAIFYKIYTKHFFLAFLIYLSHEIIFKEWIQIRAGLASALVLIMIYCLVNQQKKRFWMLVIASTLIQYVGIVSVALNWLGKEIKVKYLVGLLIFSLLIVQTGLIRNFLYYLSDLGALPGIVSLYFKWEVKSYAIGIFHFKILQQILVTFFALYLISRMPSHPSPYFTMIFNVYYLSTLSFVLLSEVAILSTRIGGYFYVVEPVLLIYLSRYFVQKRLYLLLVLFGSVLLSFINYVYRAKIDSYEMFVS